VVVDNVFKVVEEKGHFDPQAGFAHDKEPIERMAKVASEAVFLLHQQEQRS
jgi:hypothetical protein